MVLMTVETRSRQNTFAVTYKVVLHDIASERGIHLLNPGDDKVDAVSLETAVLVEL